MLRGDSRVLAYICLLTSFGNVIVFAWIVFVHIVTAFSLKNYSVIFVCRMKKLPLDKFQRCNTCTVHISSDSLPSVPFYRSFHFSCYHPSLHFVLAKGTFEFLDDSGGLSDQIRS